MREADKTSEGSTGRVRRKHEENVREKHGLWCERENQDKY